MAGRVKTSTSSQVAPDPDAIIAYLSAPIRELRTSVDGTGDPAEALGLLNNAISQLDSTEAPYRLQATDLESSWSSTAANSAIPAIRASRTRLVEGSDQTGEFATLIDAAVGTNTTAAAAIDAELDDFETRARRILKASPNEQGVTTVIELARQMYSNSLSAVDSAQADYDTYTSKLRETDYTTPKSSLGTGGGPATGDPSLTSDDDTDTVIDDTGSSSTSSDPVIAMQQTLATAGIDAATTLGTQLITSGAEVLTTLITEAAGVATHAIDVLGDEAGETITATLTGNTGDSTGTAPTANGAGAGSNVPSNGGTGGGAPLFNFGGSDKPATGANGASTGTGSNTGAAPITPKPDAPTSDGDQKPQPSPAPGTAVSPGQNSSTGAVVPPTAGQAAGTDGEHKPRPQAGTTSPSAIAGDVVAVVVPVIGAVGT
ncbi:hypothetical protein QX204_28085 [Nocardia sp. PE-7]|uniref:hypothetical protein n=2 Tax=Actinomycetes TaxID=1760 RepID=UPI0026598E6E|nr:hypothetical protein [Nocardia sp. PE-7]WKG08860.1 hypothetical protein QX204_28085 [Nocardia sp. PE-7]